MKTTVSRLLHHPATAWVVLLLSFALTGMAWYLSDSFVRQRAADRFQFQAIDVKTAIDRRMLAYQTALRGGLGLLNATERVSRAAWHAYTLAMQVDVSFPGIQGFGYSQVVWPAERERHEASIRAEGFPNYRIHPSGSRALYTSIVYLEPFNERNQRAFGFDMFSEETRRTAMQRARDTGQPALSGRVTLVQETSLDVQNGVLMYVPVYRRGMAHDTAEQRGAALQGFVYAPFRMRDLMQGILGANQGNIEFELHDGADPSPGHVLYQTQNHPAHQDVEFERTSQLNVAGRTWTLHVYARPGFLSKTEESQPLLVAIGGILVDLLLFVIIASIARQQKQAQALADAMTIDLRRSNAELEQFAYAASHDMRQPLRMVSSYLQLLESDLKLIITDDMRKNLNFAIDGAQRMDQMLNALLEYARVGHHKETLSLHNSRALLDEALHYLQPDIVSALATVRVEGDWPVVLASRDDMVRLWHNLIGNAIKFRVGGRLPQIVITAFMDDTDDSVQHFSVQDNGIGLLPGHEQRLFKVFERLQPRSKYPGTGIGLAMCRKIVEYHGGSIGVQSPGDNQGCTFSFTLPAPSVQTPASASASLEHPL